MRHQLTRLDPGARSKGIHGKYRVESRGATTPRTAHGRRESFASLANARRESEIHCGRLVRFVAAVRALRPDAIGSFDTVLDVGCFHTLRPADRPAYTHSIGVVLRPRGRLLLLVWSDRNPFGYGPARIRRRDIRGAFRDGWTIESLAAETLDTRLAQAQVHAWLAVIRRT